MIRRAGERGRATTSSDVGSRRSARAAATSRRRRPTRRPSGVVARLARVTRERGAGDGRACPRPPGCRARPAWRSRSTSRSPARVQAAPAPSVVNGPPSRRRSSITISSVDPLERRPVARLGLRQPPLALLPEADHVLEAHRPTSRRLAATVAHVRRLSGGGSPVITYGRSPGLDHPERPRVAARSSPDCSATRCCCDERWRSRASSCCTIACWLSAWLRESTK